MLLTSGWSVLALAQKSREQTRFEASFNFSLANPPWSNQNSGQLTTFPCLIMSIENYHEKIKALQESNRQVHDLIDRLANIEFQPGSVPLSDSWGGGYNDDNDGDDGVLSELVAEILQMIKEQEEDLELLHEEINDLNPGRSDVQLLSQQEKLATQVQLAIAELNIQQKTFRCAQLTARRRLEAARNEERIALTRSFLSYAEISSHPTTLTTTTTTTSSAEGGGGEGALDNRLTKKKNGLQRPLLSPLSNEAREVNSSSDVTAALRRTHDLMANELSRSQFVHDTLKESTEALAQLAETYSTLDSLLLKSKNLVGTLLSSQKSDTWYLETAFYLLLSTVCWLVFRRLLYGPMLWFLWYPVKILLRISKRLLASIT